MINNHISRLYTPHPNISMALEPTGAPSFSRSVSPSVLVNDGTVLTDITRSNASSEYVKNDNLSRINAVLEASQLEKDKERIVENKTEQKHHQLEQAEIARLSSRDREVRAHEQAHAAVGGPYAGAPKYQLEKGPDGVHYAVGGEVSIDVSKAATPQETIRKAKIVKKAALAPAEPSSQDRQVAATASRIQAQAVQELRLEDLEGQQGNQSSPLLNEVFDLGESNLGNNAMCFGVNETKTQAVFIDSESDGDNTVSSLDRTGLAGAKTYASIAEFTASRFSGTHIVNDIV